MIIEPDGKIMNKAVNNEPPLYVTLDKNVVKEVRTSFPIKQDRREELYKWKRRFYQCFTFGQMPTKT